MDKEPMMTSVVNLIRISRSTAVVFVGVIAAALIPSAFGAGGVVEGSKGAAAGTGVATTRPADPDADRLRGGASLARLMFFRQAAEEAAVDEPFRQAVVGEMDAARQQVLDVVGDKAARRAPLPQREAAVVQAQDQFNARIKAIMAEKPESAKTLLGALKTVFRDTDLLKSEPAELARIMAGLNADEQRSTAVAALLDAMRKQLSDERPPGGVTVQEHQAEVLLKTRTQLRKILSGEQWAALQAAIDAKAKADQEAKLGVGPK